MVTMPCAAARRITAGIDIRADEQPAAGRRPAGRRLRSVSTVPAPMRTPAGAIFAAISMERNGSGEFSGISIASKPASIRPRDDRFGIIGSDAAQDRDEPALQVTARRSGAGASEGRSSMVMGTLQVRERAGAPLRTVRVGPLRRHRATS